MSDSLFWGLALPLFSAVTVALVGVFTRGATDRLTYISLLNMTVAVLAVPLIPFTPWPTEKACHLLIASTLVHWIYQMSMIRTLSLGDLSLAFPLMRGLAPILIALVGTIFLSEFHSPMAWSGLVLATFALIAFGLAGHHFKTETSDPRIFLSAIATAICVAAYTVIDAEGVRAMSKGEGWGFVVWFFLVGGIPTIATGWRYRRHIAFDALLATWRPGAIAGTLSFFSYGAALLAMEHIPIAQVAAIRETSVVFAAAFGWFLLKEPFGNLRIGLSILIVAGLVVLKLA